MFVTTTNFNLIFISDKLILPLVTESDFYLQIFLLLLVAAFYVAMAAPGRGGYNGGHYGGHRGHGGHHYGHGHGGGHHGYGHHGHH
jgi:hypothetical protein